MNKRRKNGLQIAKNGGIKEIEPGVWKCPSQTTETKTYIIRTTTKGPACTCEDFELRRNTCKHIWAVDYVDYWKNIDDFKKCKLSPPNIPKINFGGGSNEPKRDERSKNRKNELHKEKRKNMDSTVTDKGRNIQGMGKRT